MRSAKVSLRITLLSCIVFLLLLTFAIVWISATRGLRASVEVMAEAASHEALARVEEQTKAQLDNAQTAGTLVSNRVLQMERARGRSLAVADLPELTTHLHEIIQVYPGLSYLSVSFAERGEYAHVQREGNKLSAVEMTRPVNGVATQTYIAYKNEARIVTRIDPNHRYDPRTRPFFKAAQRARKGVWTDSYPFVEPNGVTYPGLSLALPVYTGKRLAYVVTADFTSAKLCHFLEGIKVGQTGYAFVVDDRSSGGHVLLAHPNSDLLLQKRGNTTELARIGQVNDSILREAMGSIVKYRDKSGAYVGKVQVGSGSVTGPAGANDYFVSYARIHNIEGSPAPGLSIGTIIPAIELIGPFAVHERTISGVGIIAISLGLIVSWLISLAVSRPLQAAVRQLSDVGQMKFDLPPLMGSVLIEVSELASSVEQMKVSLRSFSRYVPTDLVSRVLATGAEPVLGGEMRELTVHFCDIAGFTSVAEKMSPQELLQLLSECLGELSEEITLSGGTIDKYIGDSIMAFWGAPEPLPDHAATACRALLRNCQRMDNLRTRLRERQLPPLYIRMALHTGTVLVGNIGSEHRLNYSVIGDTVNVASRLENLNRLYGTSILISDATRQAIGEKLIARPVDWVRVEGREGVLQIFEPFGFEGEMESADQQRYKQVVQISERASALYRARRWQEASQCFDAIQELLPGDGVATLFKTSCQAYAKNSPPESWDGVEQTFKL